MNRLNLAPRAILMAILVLAGTALADHATDDAGAGTDAGNTQAAAMPIAYGAYGGHLAPRDWDWFRVEAPSAGPRCIQADVSGENHDTARLTVESPDRARSLRAQFPGGGSASLALAVPAVARTYFDITPSGNLPGSGDPARPGHYAFHLRETGIPVGNMGDALTSGDAGNEISKATPAPGPCIGGRIDPLRNIGDARDVYSITVGAGQVVTYSFAATGSPGVLTLSLLDAAGESVGPALVSGQVAQVQVPAGTYYLSASRVSLATEEVGYVIGIIQGPPDPGSSCRPYC